MAAHPKEDFMTMMKRTIFHPLHPAGYPFVIAGLVITFFAFLIWDTLGTLALIATLFVVYFFRDPPRVVPQGEDLIIAPADGRICEITKGTTLPKDLMDEDDVQAAYTKISIFMSAVDVHVNRNPVSGTVLKTAYRPGKYLNAADSNASEKNERTLALIETEKGQKIGLVQVAGMIARRIVTDHEDGQSITAGEKFGIIKFGSRCDVYVPDNIAPRVALDQRCIGGETVLTDLSAASGLALEGKKAA